MIKTRNTKCSKQIKHTRNTQKYIDKAGTKGQFILKINIFRIRDIGCRDVPFKVYQFNTSHILVDFRHTTSYIICVSAHETISSG